MTKQIINIGSGELTGDGESLRAAFVKVNDNFDEVYAAVDTIPVNVGDLNNNVGYLTTATLPPQHILSSGTAIVSLAANGALTLPAGLYLPISSLTETTASVEVIVSNETLSIVVDYSTGPDDNLPVNIYGTHQQINAPWATYQFTRTPNPALEVGDIIAGAGIPVDSTVVVVGEGTYSNIIVTNLTITGPIPPGGEVINIVRPITNRALRFGTTATTDISMVVGEGGRIIYNSSLIPDQTDVYDIGSPAKRIRRLWMGAGSIYVQDEATGGDLRLTAINGDFVIAGAAGLRVGEFTFNDNEIKLANPERDILFGQIGATGAINFRRKINVRDATDSFNLFAVDPQGRVDILSDIATDPTQAALSIVGARTKGIQPANNLGVLLQLTGTRLAPTRLYNDSYGVNNYSAFIGRHARGDSTATEQTLVGDIIARVGANPHDGVSFANISTMRIDFVNAEDQTPTARGSQIEFWTTPVGSTVISKRVTINDGDIVLTASGNGGIEFQDSTRQTTAWTGTVHVNQIVELAGGVVTKINVGNGLTQTTSTGIVGIDATGVQTVVGTANRVIVTDSGGKNLTLSTPQDLATTSSVTFQNITVTGNINIIGTATIATNASIIGKILYLASSATNTAQLDGGGISLGTGTISKSILYSLANNWWDTDGAGVKTLQLDATTASIDTLVVQGSGHFGASYLGYDFSNAEIQVDSNINSYSQIVGKNHSTGTNASADFVAANDIGTDSNNYIDLGINSSAYANADYSIGGANDGYLYIDGGDLTVGTATAGTEIRFHTGGTTSDKLRATITDAGLTVVGTVNGLTLPGTSSTAGYVLSNNGTGTLTWVQPQTGYVGSRGVNGFTGSQGIQGTAGYTGSTGATGYTGYTGYTGSRGTDGVVGYNGSIGFTGSKGDTGTGYTGSTGSIGGTGYTGSAGTNGTTGYAGSQGLQGLTGFVGSAGTNGTNGTNGFTGSAGVQGTAGFTGSQGTTGTTGATGYTGSKGEQGTIGNTGYAGSAGTNGTTGFTGSAGIQGNAGSTGATGYTGSDGGQGLPGATGYTGSRGNDGTNGTIGYTGSQGIQGISGNTGYTGSQGVGYAGSAGTNGTNGYTGSAGTNGTNGYTGSAGTNGTNGYTGSKGDLGYVGSQGIQGITGNTGYTGSASTTPYIKSIGIQGDGVFTATSTVTSMLFAPGGRMVLNIATGSNVITITDYAKGSKKHRAKHKSGAYEPDIDMATPEDTITYEEGNGILLATNTSTNTLTISAEFTGTLVYSGTLTVNPTSVGKTSVATQTFTITGLSTSHKVVITPTTALTYGIFISAAWPSAINTLSVQFMNISGGSIDLGSITIDYFAWL